MSDYGKLKNAELEGLLKSRGLPSHGKKQDMVNRLKEDDQKKTSETAEADKATGAEAATTKQAAARPKMEDEIDWDDDAIEDEPAPAPPAATIQDAPAAAAPTETPASATTTEATGGDGPADNTQTQVPDVDPSKTDDLAVKAPAEADAPQADEIVKDVPELDIAEDDPDKDLKDQLNSQIKRAKKFKSDVTKVPEYKRILQVIEDNTQMRKQLLTYEARAKKFEFDVNTIKDYGEIKKALEANTGKPSSTPNLDAALGEGNPRKRGREGDNRQSQSNKRRGGPNNGRGAPRGRGRGGNNRGRSRYGTDYGLNPDQSKIDRSKMSKEELDKVAERQKRFANPSGN